MGKYDYILNGDTCIIKYSIIKIGIFDILELFEIYQVSDTTIDATKLICDLKELTVIIEILYNKEELSHLQYKSLMELAKEVNETILNN